MLSLLKELYSLLTPRQRKRFLRLQVLVVIMAFAEIASVAAIAPFMAVVGDMSRLEGDGMLAQLYAASGADSPGTFLFWLGSGVLLVMVVGTGFSMLTTWRMAMFAHSVGAQISQRLYTHYLHQPWLFHASGSSSQLTKQVAQETGRVTNGILNPVLQLNAKLTMAGFMVVGLVFYDPKVAFVGLAVFLFSYVLLFKVVRKRLADNGHRISNMNTLRYKLMNEGFGGIKDVLLLGRQALFTQRFIQSSDKLARAQGVNQALSEVPRYAMQLIAFGSIMLLVLYLLGVHQGSLGHMLPVLSVYALAGFKMLPAFQQAYQSLAKIKGNTAAFESIREAMQQSYQQAIDQDAVVAMAAGELATTDKLAVNEEIQLRNISLTYPGKEEPALNDLTLTIPARQVIGLVGASGSGKSTAIDVLLGLIQPQQGELLVDGQPINDANRRQWQNSIGFVPQSIFLADASIRENIAFGIPPEKIDEARVQQAAQMAHLDELLEELPQGLHTRVGERGVQLSGGQRQRIGIARALYDDADVLILDEATSALDGITEKLIMDAIHDFSGKKTIVMIAHRLATVRQCDSIYLLANGQSVDDGCYSELAERNTIFQRMAEHA
ncbi:ABC transporter ATP-binding protein [Halomonas sp. MCCC 1A11062]|uniref:ABC transporter ATP-binding protein n=1 Tax=Halomonas sp. MCCC 1A11062 TaxID=2733485 RepID=UPI001F31B4A8|nr:ABC transporter ATP-binding protein [Halomonas sp. MCCC 1A11062]MCE8038915.1 ABC transporter ATP-binding protein [Halomonas sp. MCCC 1A11062]